MSTECCSAPSCGDRQQQRGGRRGRVASLLTFAPGIGLALLPKCPMCIAAYLAPFGFGMAAAGTLAPWCAPVAAVLIAVSALALLSASRPRPRR